MKLIFICLSFVNISLMGQGYVCAIGGGSEDYGDWSDEPYSWIVQKSDSGKIIILGASSDVTSWLPNYFMSLGADTAYNKTISTTSIANLQSTYDELITAKAIFIRGGDQWDYVSQWKGTKTDSAIQYVFNNGGIVAGTSAGAAVLGDVDFSAQNGSAYPDEALENPFYSRMKFENNFLKLVPDVLFDTHFIERGRHGRLIAMLYNQHFNLGRDLIGVGIDDRTAICISLDGIGEVMGSGAVTIFYKDDVTKYSPISSGKYTIENLKSHTLTKGWKFNFNTKEIVFIPSSAKDVDKTRTWQYPLTSFYLTGNDDISANLNNLSEFLLSNNSTNIVVMTHPGFTNSLSSLTNYLSTNNFNYSVVNVSLANLNNQTEADKINNVACFVFAGDSLNVLAYLNQSGNLVADAFKSGVQSSKPIFFFGNTGKISGQFYVGNTDTDIYSSYRGKMTFNNGLNVFGELVFQPLVFDNEDYFENRMSSVLWGMMRGRKRVGIFLNGNNRVQINSGSKSISGNTNIPFIVVDSREAAKVDSSTYRASGSAGPRQVVAFDNLRWSLTNYPDIKYLLQEGRFDYLSEIENENETIQPEGFVLYQNYPNPFNSRTRIKFNISDVIFRQAQDDSNVTLSLSKSDIKVSLAVYDILGREVSTLVNDYKPAGTYEIEFDASHLPSGIYFYRLLVGNYSVTKSMVLIK